MNIKQKIEEWKAESVANMLPLLSVGQYNDIMQALSDAYDVIKFYKENGIEETQRAKYDDAVFFSGKKATEWMKKYE